MGTNGRKDITNMHEVKTSKQKGSLILKIAVAAFACYIIYLLISQQVSINNKKTEILKDFCLFALAFYCFLYFLGETPVYCLKTLAKKL